MLHMKHETEMQVLFYMDNAASSAVRAGLTFEQFAEVTGLLRDLRKAYDGAVGRSKKHQV